MSKGITNKEIKALGDKHFDYVYGLSGPEGTMFASIRAKKSYMAGIRKATLLLK